MRFHLFFESFLHSSEFLSQILNCKFCPDWTSWVAYGVSTLLICPRNLIRAESIVEDLGKLLHLFTHLIELFLAIVAHLPLIFLQEIHILFLLLGLIGQLSANHLGDLLFECFLRFSLIVPIIDLGGSTWLISLKMAYLQVLSHLGNIFQTVEHDLSLTLVD